MKNAALVGTLLLSLVGAVHASAESCSSLVITGHPNYRPISWAAEGGVAGSVADLMAEVAADLGVTNVRTQDFGTWAAAQEATKEGKADIIFGIYRTADREAWLDFMEPPLLSDPVAIAVREGTEISFSNWSDLTGLRGVKSPGESFGDAFDSFAAEKLSLETAEGVEAAFKTLIDGKADYLVIGLLPGKAEAETLGVADSISFLPKRVDSFDMFAGFSQRSACAGIRDAFAARMSEKLKEGALGELEAAAQE